MEEDNVAIRLKGFILSQGLTNSQFADKCGIPRPSLSQLLGGRNKKISDVIVGQIHQAYPELSVLWLMFGEGEMMVDSKKPVQIPRQSTTPIGQNGMSDLDLFGEESEFTTDMSAPEKSENVKPLNTAKKQTNTINIQRVESTIETVELMKQIEKMKKNPRKVSQITVYYDDSTFETFYPRR